MKRHKHKIARTTLLAAAVLATVSAFGNTDRDEVNDAKENYLEAKQDAQMSAQEAKVQAREAWQDAKQETNEARYAASSATENAWLHGKLETTLLLNRHLNSFTIDSRVEDGTAYLDGTVESEIDKDLAGEVAMNIEGINQVENNLSVDPASARDETEEAGAERTFGERIEDATTTAAVKTRLLTNEHTDGLKINVDTNRDVVTLRGSVESDEERQLAEKLAANTEDVRSVVNELEVSEANAG